MNLIARGLALPSNLASRRLWATRLLNVLATFPRRLNNVLMVTVLVVSYLKEKPVAIGFSYRMEKLNDQDQTSVGCTIRRSHARSSRYGSGEPCDLAAPRRGRQCGCIPHSPLF